MALLKNIFARLRRNPKGIPLFKRLTVDLQSNCNRDCFFCPRQGDDSGKRLFPDGRKVIQSMPTENVLDILDQASALGFKGRLSFEFLSEPFLDPRIIEMARETRKRSMRPYVHTNGDVLRDNDDLCRQTVEVFEYIVVGLYDYESDEELAQEKRFWQEKLVGAELSFSEIGKVIPRTDVPDDPRLIGEKKTYPHSPCFRPVKRLLIHYDGEVALCCEDMKAEFDLGNAFETPIEEIWFSEKHLQIIKDLKKGLRTKYPLCSRCAFKGKK